MTSARVNQDLSHQNMNSFTTVSQEQVANLQSQISDEDVSDCLLFFYEQLLLRKEVKDIKSDPQRLGEVGQSNPCFPLLHSSHQT